MQCKGIALHYLRRFKEAVSAYDKAIAIKPDYNDAHFNKGIVLEELGLDKEAKKAFAQAERFEKMP